MDARLLDTNAVLDENGDLFLWGYFGVLNYKTAGDGGPGGGPNGAPSAPVYLADRAIYNPPTRFKALDGLTGVAATAYTVATIDSDGNLWSWGDFNTFPWFKDIKGNIVPEKVPDGAKQHNLAASTWQPVAQNVVDVAAAEYAYAYLTSDGKVWTAGHDSFGQRASGAYGIAKNKKQQSQIPDNFWPVLPTAYGGDGVTPNKIVALYNGYEGFMAQDEFGNIYAWGRSFESGLGTSGYFLNGCQEDKLKGNTNHTRNNEGFPYDPETCPVPGAVLTYSKAAGLNGNDWYVVKPIFIPEVTALSKAHGGVRKLILGYQHGVLLAEDGSVILWGSDEGNRNGAGRIDWANTGIEGLRPYVLCLDANLRQPLPEGKNGDVSRRPLTEDSGLCTNVKAVSITATQFASSLVTENGEIYAWGSFLLGGAFGTKAQLRGVAPKLDEGEYKQDGYRNNYSMLHLVWNPALDAAHRKAVAVGANKDSGITVLDDGTILTWGENGGGAACGGYGYKTCMPDYWGPKTYGAAFPDAVRDKKGPLGDGYYMHNAYADLYIWPPLPVSNLQSIKLKVTP
ncbi:hypothetical protein AGMMS49543_25440 [Betaproteobacteria bacterium]|nr:hypothetical protein AGMMS49543_25440 [Betaproteobacteria bacterium]GHU10430.1 hypothetical protein AGMMS50225_13900 [Betaproteobacteria bacterium]GHU15915.1 hypothetical protein AGMMS50243_00730 [Betaproteobacteria bacterium]